MHLFISCTKLMAPSWNGDMTQLQESSQRFSEPQELCFTRVLLQLWPGSEIKALKLYFVFLVKRWEVGKEEGKLGPQRTFKVVKCKGSHRSQRLGQVPHPTHTAAKTPLLWPRGFGGTQPSLTDRSLGILTSESETSSIMSWVVQANVLLTLSHSPWSVKRGHHTHCVGLL